MFDPEKMPWWSLPMVLAWIAWRDTTIVREHCDEYRQDWRAWFPVSCNIPDGDKLVRVDGYELRPVGRSTACTLAMIEISLRSSKNLPLTTKMTVSEAERELIIALAAGRIAAIGKDHDGVVVEIPKREWPYLQFFEENDRDVLKRDALAQPAFCEIKLERGFVQELWPAFPIEPYMIEPMTREGTAGYVPLCAALHYVVTNGGCASVHLEDSEPWERSVAAILPMLSTGEIEIVGKPVDGGPAEKIDQLIFAQVHLTQPLRTSISGRADDDPWISCMLYVDNYHWTNGFNDQLYMRRGTTPTWTHLQVKKADVLRAFSFAAKSSLSAGPSEEASTDLPPVQASVLKAVAQLWPDGQIPPRTKDRNAAICEHLKMAISAKTIQRAFARRG